MAARTAMEHPIDALPRTPFPASRDFPSRGNEKIGGTGYCVTYDTESQSRNVLASPLGEEGHEVAKGCTRVRMIMLLDVDVTAAGGIIKLIALRAIPQPSGQRPVKLKNPPANGRSILRTFPWCPPPWSSASAPPKEPHYFLSKNFTISWGISFFRSMAGRSPWSRYFSFSERRVSM